MSFRNRFVDGINSLFESLADSSDNAVDTAGLEKEARYRQAAHASSGSPNPTASARARLAGAGSAALKERIALAAKRIARIHKARKVKAASQKRDQEAAFRNMANEARKAPPRRSSSSSYRSRPSSSRSRASRPSIFQKKDLAAHYKTLGVDYGADATTVKKAYRKLMRKYHPDLHQDPKKKKAATRLTVKISTAYNEIEKSRK